METPQMIVLLEDYENHQKGEKAELLSIRRSYAGAYKVKFDNGEIVYLPPTAQFEFTL